MKTKNGYIICLLIISNLFFLFSGQAAEKENFYSGKTYIQLPPSPPSEPYDSNDPRWTEWRRRNKEDRDWEWRMPINFYGKVVDENNRPVEGVEIYFTWTDISAKGNGETTLRSDANGLFSLTEIKGKHLAVASVKKEGYHTSLKQNHFSFEYAAFFDEHYHIPDSNNPVIFHLIKKGEIEPLYFWEKFYGLSSDGTPHYFDLRKQRKIVGGLPQGDFVIRVVRRQTPPHGEKFDWSVAIEGVNDTKLIESEEEFMFKAPEDGYKTSYFLQKNISESDWQPDIVKKFYIKTADGKFGRWELEIRPRYNDKAAIDMEFYFNPSGSRNLEFDSAKALPGSD